MNSSSYHTTTTDVFTRKTQTRGSFRRSGQSTTSVRRSLRKSKVKSEELRSSVTSTRVSSHDPKTDVLRKEFIQRCKQKYQKPPTSAATTTNSFTTDTTRQVAVVAPSLTHNSTTPANRTTTTLSTRADDKKNQFPKPNYQPFDPVPKWITPEAAQRAAYQQQQQAMYLQQYQAMQYSMQIAMQNNQWTMEQYQMNQQYMHQYYQQYQQWLQAQAHSAGNASMVNQQSMPAAPPSLPAHTPASTSTSIAQPPPGTGAGLPAATEGTNLWFQQKNTTTSSTASAAAATAQAYQQQANSHHSSPDMPSENRSSVHNFEATAARQKQQLTPVNPFFSDDNSNAVHQQSDFFKQLNRKTNNTHNTAGAPVKPHTGAATPIGGAHRSATATSTATPGGGNDRYAPNTSTTANYTTASVPKPTPSEVAKTFSGSTAKIDWSKPQTAVKPSAAKKPEISKSVTKTESTKQEHGKDETANKTLKSQTAVASENIKADAPNTIEKESKKHEGLNRTNMQPVRKPSVPEKPTKPALSAKPKTAKGPSSTALSKTSRENDNLLNSATSSVATAMTKNTQANENPRPAVHVKPSQASSSDTINGPLGNVRSRETTVSTEAATSKVKHTHETTESNSFTSVSKTKVERRKYTKTVSTRVSSLIADINTAEAHSIHLRNTAENSNVTGRSSDKHDFERDKSSTRVSDIVNKMTHNLEHTHIDNVSTKTQDTTTSARTNRELAADPIVDSLQQSLAQLDKDAEEFNKLINEVIAPDNRSSNTQDNRTTISSTTESAPCTSQTGSSTTRKANYDKRLQREKSHHSKPAAQTSIDDIVRQSQLAIERKKAREKEMLEEKLRKEQQATERQKAKERQLQEEELKKEQLAIEKQKAKEKQLLEEKMRKQQQAIEEQKANERKLQEEEQKAKEKEMLEEKMRKAQLEIEEQKAKDKQLFEEQLKKEQQRLEKEEQLAREKQLALDRQLAIEKQRTINLEKELQLEKQRAMNENLAKENKSQVLHPELFEDEQLSDMELEMAREKYRTLEKQYNDDQQLAMALQKAEVENCVANEKEEGDLAKQIHIKPVIARKHKTKKNRDKRTTADAASLQDTQQVTTPIISQKATEKTELNDAEIFLSDALKQVSKKKHKRRMPSPPPSPPSGYAPRQPSTLDTAASLPHTEVFEKQPSHRQSQTRNKPLNVPGETALPARLLPDVSLGNPAGEPYTDPDQELPLPPPPLFLLEPLDAEQSIAGDDVPPPPPPPPLPNAVPHPPSSTVQHIAGTKLPPSITVPTAPPLLYTVETPTAPPHSQSSAIAYSTASSMSTVATPVPPPPPPLPQVNATAPPPPQPPPPPAVPQFTSGQSAPDATRSALLDSIRSSGGVTRLKKVEKSSPSRKDQITRAGSLPHIGSNTTSTAEHTPSNKRPSSTASAGIAQALAKALADRSKIIQSDSESEEENIYGW